MPSYFCWPLLGCDPTPVPGTPDGEWHKLTHGGCGEHEHEHERERIGFTGKVEGLVYDHLGDFSGFVLETYEDHQHRFESR